MTSSRIGGYGVDAMTDGLRAPVTRRGLRAQRKRAVRARRLRSMLFSTLVMGVCTVLGVGAAQGTYALLSSTTAVPSATVRSGTAGLQINGVTWPTVALIGAMNALAPTRPTAKAFEVKNTGNVSLDLVASITTSAGAGLKDYLTVRLSPVASAAACTTTTRPTTAFTAFTNVGVGSVSTGASQWYCLEVWLSASTPSALSGTSISAFTLTLDAKQRSF